MNMSSCHGVRVLASNRAIRHPLCIKSPTLSHISSIDVQNIKPQRKEEFWHGWASLSLCASLKLGSKLFFDKDGLEIFPAPSLPPANIANYLQVTSPSFEISTSWLALFTVKPFTWQYPTWTARGREGFQTCLCLPRPFHVPTVPLREVSGCHAFVRPNLLVHHSYLQAISKSKLQQAAWWDFSKWGSVNTYQNITYLKKNTSIVCKRMPVPHCHVKSSVFAREEQVAKPSKAIEGLPGLPAAEVRKSKAPKRLEASAARSSDCCSLAETKWMQVVSNS